VDGECGVQASCGGTPIVSLPRPQVKMLAGGIPMPIRRILEIIICGL
jgi:hypothetical protein